MSDNTYDNLKQTARRAAHLYAALQTDKPFVEIYNRADDGMDIPPFTRIVVSIRLEHTPEYYVQRLEQLEAVSV